MIKLSDLEIIQRALHFPHANLLFTLDECRFEPCVLLRNIISEVKPLEEATDRIKKGFLALASK